ncbi:MAG: hypothetical protein AAB397_02690 [Patescibacteria group bacterium]
MNFPFYGHSESFFWFNIGLACFGVFWALVLNFWLSRRKQNCVWDWVCLLWFAFWLPHSSYLALELPKHLIRIDSVLEPLTSAGFLTYLGISFLSAAICVAQISIALNSWALYRKKGIILAFLLVMIAASFGTLIGLCGVNFYSSPSDVAITIKNLMLLKITRDPFNCGHKWPRTIGIILFLGWSTLYFLFNRFIWRGGEEENK